MFVGFASGSPLTPVNEIDLEPVECDVAFESTQADVDTQSSQGFGFDQTRFDDWGPGDES